MPDPGELTRDRLPSTLPLTIPLYPPPPWPLPGARVLKLTYETDARAVLRWLPASLARTAPPYAIVIVSHYPESPVGPFSLAAQYLGCRARMFIRAFTLHAVTDSEPALAALRESWGFPARLGKVRLTAGQRGVRAGASTGGRSLADVRLTRREPCDPQLVRFDPVLNLRLIPSLHQGKRHSLTELVQIDPDHAVQEASRGTGSLTYPSASGGDPWHLLPVRNVISATYCVVDTELPLARFVMPY